MKYKTIALTSIFLSGIIMFLSALIIFNILLSQTMDSAKYQETIRDKQLIELTIKETELQLLKNSKDWSIWDDTYEYVMRPENSTYEEDNLDDSTLEALDISGILIMDSKKNIVTEIYHNITDNTPLILTEKELEIIHETAKQASEKNITGALKTENNVLIYAGSRIYTSDETLDSEGYLFMYKIIEYRMEEWLTNHLNKPITIELTDRTIEEQYPESIKVDDNTYYIEIAQDKFYTLTSIYDINKKTIAIIKIYTDWKIYKKIYRFFWIFIAGLFIIIFGVVIVAAHFSGKYLVKIDKLDQTITEITKTGKTRKIEQSYKKYDPDELKTLTTNFNNMIDRIHLKEDDINEKNIELEKANKGLKIIDKTKDELMSSVSHELRTPLTGIKSYVELLKDEGLGPILPEQKEALTTIDNCCDELNQIVTHLLDVKKFESGQMKLIYEKCSMKKEIEYIINELSAKIKEVNGEIILKDRTKSSNIMADKTKIHQVIRNIISNSIKYKSNKDLKIHIELQESKDTISINISDNGIGIDEDKIKNLFHKFYQADQSMNKKVGGSGLGLYLVKQIVEAHKGTIDVKSKKNLGTKFTIMFPKNAKDQKDQIQ